MGVIGMKLGLVCLVLASGLGPGCADYLPAEGSEHELRPIGGVVGAIESSVAAPIRVLFVIDASQSMLVTDPDGRRLDALREVFESCENQTLVEFGVIGFSGRSVLWTASDENGDGMADSFFTRDPQRLDRALTRLAEVHGTTSYRSALINAEESIRNDLFNLGSDRWEHASYRLVFLSDGLPYPVLPDDDINTRADIFSLVEGITALKTEYGLAKLRIDTAYLFCGNTPPGIRLAAADLLSEMAGLSGGSYTEFEEIEELSFLHLGLGTWGF
jgi:hypothetical protein